MRKLETPHPLREDLRSISAKLDKILLGLKAWEKRDIRHHTADVVDLKPFVRAMERLEGLEKRLRKLKRH